MTKLYDAIDLIKKGCLFFTTKTEQPVRGRRILSRKIMVQIWGKENCDSTVLTDTAQLTGKLGTFSSEWIGTQTVHL